MSEAASKSVTKKKAVVKKKSVTKAKTKAKVDLILDTAHELENLTKVKAYKMVHELAETADYTFFQLGGVLSVIQSNGWFTDEGFDNFKAFVESEFGINYRKSMYMIAIYNGLVESGVEWSQVKDIGWTKLKELANILSPDNVEEWVGHANDMTVLQLQEYIKQQAKGDLEGSGEKEETKNTVSTMTFKVHEDQKEVIEEAIDKAKGEADTDVNTVALEAICLNYISGGSAKAKPASLKQVMKKHSWEEILEAFEGLFPNIDLTVEDKSDEG